MGVTIHDKQLAEGAVQRRQMQRGGSRELRQKET